MLGGGGGVVQQIWVWYHYTGGDYRLRLNIMLLVKCYSRRVVMVAHGVMYDIRYPRQEEALRLAKSPGDFRRNKLMSGTSWFRELGRGRGTDEFSMLRVIRVIM